MSRLELADNNVATETNRASPPYVPPLQRTAGQPPPIAANGGLSYMSFDRDGDAGTNAALADALIEIAEGEGQRVTDMINNAPPGAPIKTRWGLGFRKYDECVDYIRRNNAIKAPEGGIAVPLPYAVYERPTYSVVPSNAVWRDPARADMAMILHKNEEDNRRRDLWFPQVMRDARRIGDYYKGLAPDSPECMDRLGVRWRISNPSAKTFTMRRRWSACSTPRSRSSCWSSFRARPMRWYTTTTSSTRTTRATARKTRTTRTRV
jgi:hypothetical protein